ncbi:hypothetical protein VPH35_114036 [Triticum aestivum]
MDLCLALLMVQESPWKTCPPLPASLHGFLPIYACFMEAAIAFVRNSIHLHRSIIHPCIHYRQVIDSFPLIAFNLAAMISIYPGRPVDFCSCHFSHLLLIVCGSGSRSIMAEADLMFNRVYATINRLIYFFTCHLFALKYPTDLSFLNCLCAFGVL